MAHLHDQQSSYALLLQRYLGPEQAEALLDAQSSPQVLFAAYAHLVSAYYAVSTYLPRRLLAHQSQAVAGPWLEWVEGSLLFTDVSGSTALAEQLTALGREGTEIVTATLNDYFGTMIRIIQDAGGDLLTFGGDALLVLFSDAQHSLTAANVALDLLHELRDFQRHVPGIGTFPLSMHIGVESGRLALVSAGMPTALRYSAMGHTVNAVARAEGYGGRGEVVLGPQAWAAVVAHAEGIAVADGFVRLHALHTRPAPAPRPADDHQSPMTLAGLSGLAQRLDRIAPYLPDTLLERILADPQRPRLEADLRPVSVLFAQISGLSELVESLPSERAAAMVDRCLQALQRAIQPFGGFVNKLDLADDGDKVLAIFGALVAYEDHAERAARAALAMQQSLAGLSFTAELPDHVQLQMRIGLNTGNVFAGNVGAAERKEYTVMGDAVNVAARVMSSAAWGEIRVTASAAAALDALHLSDPIAVAVKGKAEKLDLLRLDGEREVRLDLSSETPLVGRERELAWLRERMHTAAGGAGRAIEIVGEAGVGKTRLVTALLAEVSPAAAVISVRCHSFNTTTPYAPWGDLLRELCAIAPRDNQHVRAQRLEDALTAAGVSADDWLPILADLVRVRADDNLIVRGLDPQQRQERRFALMLTLLRAAAQRQPAGLVLVFDNLHWADHVSRELWCYVAARLADAPILLLGLLRGDAEIPAEPIAHLEQLTLEELDPASAAALIARIRPDLSSELAAAVIQRAAGNPLFLEELLRAVGNSGDAVALLPDSLNGLLLARLDRLDERSRSLLRIAAVIGQRFPIDVLQSLRPEDYESLIQQLLRLDAQELISTEREQPERVHLFRHALLQEVAYQSLLYARRRELHRKIGEYLERRYADGVAQVRAEYEAARSLPLVQIGRNGSLISRMARGDSATIFLLAHHYRLSDKPVAAAPYLLLAGHAARDDYANEQAVQYYRWTLESIDNPHDPHDWEAREALGDVLCTLGRYDEAQQEYAALLSLDLALPPAVVAEVLRSWGDALEKQGRYQEALEKLHAAEAVVEAHLNAVPPLMLSAIYTDMATVLRLLGNYDQALQICESGLARIRTDRRSAEDERIEAELQQQIGSIHGMRGQYEQARFHFENALAALEAIDDYYGCARLQNNLGYLAQLQSRFDIAALHYEQAEALARKVSARYLLAGIQLNASYAYYCLDRYSEAAEACDDVRRICSEMGDRDGIAKSADLLGNIAYNRGQYPQALAHYDDALSMHHALGSSYQQGNTLAMRAAALIALDRSQEAIACAQQALEIAEQLDAPQLRLEARLVNLEARLRQVQDRSQLDALENDLQTTIALAEQLDSRIDMGVAYRLRGRIAALARQPFDDDFAAAEAVFVAAGSAFEQARTWADWGHALRSCNDPRAAAYLKRAEETFTQIEAAGELRRLRTHHERSV